MKSYLSYKGISYLGFKEMQRKLDDISKTSRKCKCGHTVDVANKSGRAECNYCHNLVFKDEATKFKYIMNRKLIEERRNINEKYNSKKN